MRRVTETAPPPGWGGGTFPRRMSYGATDTHSDEIRPPSSSRLGEDREVMTRNSFNLFPDTFISPVTPPEGGIRRRDGGKTTSRRQTPAFYGPPPALRPSFSHLVSCSPVPTTPRFNTSIPLSSIFLNPPVPFHCLPFSREASTISLAAAG